MIMGIRTNTLGKSAIINQQLNKSYDVVEYVAENLPLIAELSKRLSIYTDSDVMLQHVENEAIHLSTKEKEVLDYIVENGSIVAKDLTSIVENVEALREGLTSHETDYTLHLSVAQNELLERLWSNIDNIPKNTLAGIAYSGSYTDLKDIPETKELDTTLSTTSTNGVTNKAITTEINNIKELVSTKTSDTSLHPVAFNGDFNSLMNKPIVTEDISSGNSNAVSSNAIYQVLGNLDKSGVGRISEEEIDMLFTTYEEPVDG